MDLLFYCNVDLYEGSRYFKLEPGWRWPPSGFRVATGRPSGCKFVDGWSDQAQLNCNFSIPFWSRYLVLVGGGGATPWTRGFAAIVSIVPNSSRLGRNEAKKPTKIISNYYFRHSDTGVVVVVVVPRDPTSETHITIRRSG